MTLGADEMRRGALPAPGADLMLAAALFAVDPPGLGGVALRGPAGVLRDHWLSGLRALLPDDAPMQRIPINIPDERLLGGLDIAATLCAGRPVGSRGLLADADGGVIILAMAERLSGAAIARIVSVADAGEVRTMRDGVELSAPAQFGIVALDEGIEPDERPLAALTDRLAIHLDFEAVRSATMPDIGFDRDAVTAARARLPSVTMDARFVEALTGAAFALGIASIRAPILALRLARAAAALAGRLEVTEADAATAARLVLAPRATRMPAPEDEAEDETEAEPPPPEPDAPDDEDNGDEKPLSGEALDEIVLAAVAAALPQHLLAELKARGALKPRSPASGRAGMVRNTLMRGREAGVRRGDPRSGARLSIVETLRAAAPWQPLRRRERVTTNGNVIEIRRDDFRIKRFEQKSETATIFVVDASGSAAFNRLAEAKGAVELLLADCYVRRDQVALISFGGRGAELLLPPTRSLARAKKCLAHLPGGGGTPLASGLDAAAMLADALSRKSQTPSIILLTDGKANIARDGSHGRVRADADAVQSARAIRASRFAAILIDMSPTPQPQAGKLAAEMGARYLALPHARARELSAAIKAAGAAGPPDAGLSSRPALLV